MNSKKLLTSERKNGLLFILSAASGTGKTTLSDRLLQDPPVPLERAVTYTTRAPRPNETADQDYHFVSKETFEEMISQEAFYEHATIFGEYYGTERKSVDHLLASHKNVLLVIDVLGAKQIRQQRPCITIFLAPPDADTLLHRLQQRATDSDQEVQLRTERAKKEFESAKNYDYIVTNDDLEVATETIKSIIIAEEHAVRNL